MGGRRWHCHATPAFYLQHLTCYQHHMKSLHRLPRLALASCSRGWTWGKRTGGLGGHLWHTFKHLNNSPFRKDAERWRWVKIGVLREMREDNACCWSCLYSGLPFVNTSSPLRRGCGLHYGQACWNTLLQDGHSAAACGRRHRDSASAMALPAAGALLHCSSPRRKKAGLLSQHGRMAGQ